MSLVKSLGLCDNRRTMARTISEKPDLKGNAQIEYQISWIKLEQKIRWIH